jgi:hypothetical protein
MSESHDGMVRALKAIVVPRLHELGFAGSYPHFRRRGETRLDLLMFQFDRHGGGFVLELARCPPVDLGLPWGDRVPVDEIRAFQPPISQRARIQHRPGPSRMDWFRYDSGDFEQTGRVALAFIDDADRLFANFRSSHASS